MITVYKFKKAILFVVLYMVICNMVESTLPEFYCDINGNVILRNSTDVAKIVIFKANKTLCRPDTTNITGSCGQEANSPITIAYGDHVRIGNDMIGGNGSNYTKLSCKDKDTLVFATVKNVIGTPIILPEHEIAMKYAIKLSIDGLSNSKAANLGEKFTLLLEGPDIRHKLQPTECRAFPTGNPTNDHSIWKLPNETSGECFNEPSVIKQKWDTEVAYNAAADPHTTTKAKLSIEMYAFRFAKSPSVTIECSAYVCPSASSDCTDKCVESVVKHQKSNNHVDKTRRRRAIHGIQTSPKLNTTSRKIMIASTSFQVQLGDQHTGNSAARLSKNVQLYSLASIFVLMVTMMIR